MYDPLMNDILAKLNSVEKSSTPKRTNANQESGNEMLDILKRFHLAESGDGKLTPVNVKHGLNAQQKSVGQTPANFKPKTTKVLTAPTDPKNPFAGKLVGSSESKKNKKSMIDEAEVSEDLLSDIKKSLSDYIKQIDDIEKVDTDLKKKDKKDTDLKKKEKRDRDLVVRKVKEDPTQENPTIQPKPASLTDPTYANSGAIQTPTIDTDSSQGIQPVSETIPRSFTSVKTHECNGKVFEVVEDERGGFNIRHNNKISPSRFKTFLEADTALQLFTHRLSSTGDYREER